MRLVLLAATLVLLSGCDRSGDATRKGATAQGSKAEMPAATSSPDQSPSPPPAEQLSASAVLERLGASAPAPVSTEGIEFGLCKNELCFTQGHQKYSLEVVATRLGKVDAAPGSYSLKYLCDYCCGADEEQELVVKRDSVAARLQNASAFRLHQQKQYAKAAAGFAESLRLDPELLVARTNLACALNQSGKPDEAAAVLLGKSGALSPQLLEKILSDGELAGLEKHPRVARQLAQKRGTARLSLTQAGQLKDFDVALSRELSLAAVVSVHQSWGTAARGSYLEIFDSKSGARIYRHRFIGMAQTADGDLSEGVVTVAHRAEVAKRLAVLTELLQLLGFEVPPAQSVHVATAQAAGPGSSFFLDAEKVGVTSDARTLRTFREGKLVQSFQTELGLGFLTSALYLPGEQLLVVESHIDEPEGCYLGADIAVSAVMPVDLRLAPAD